MRYLAISDIHGCITEFEKLLEKIGYDKNKDQLILMGDYVDRGMKSKQVVDKVIGLVKDGAIALRGNHDQMLLLTYLYPETEEYHVHWINNGGLQTLQSYFGTNSFEEGFDWEEYKQAHGYINEHYKHHMEFFKSLPFYYETSSHIYVHAGIDPFYEDFKKTPVNEFIWIRDMFFRHQLNNDKVVVFGHTPTQTLHNDRDDNNIWFDQKYGDKIGIDGACAYGGQLNCLIYDDEDGSYEQISVKRGEEHDTKTY